MSHSINHGGITSKTQHCNLAHCKLKHGWVDQVRKLMNLRSYQYSTADSIVRFHQKRGTSDKLSRRIEVK